MAHYGGERQSDIREETETETGRHLCFTVDVIQIEYREQQPVQEGDGGHQWPRFIATVWELRAQAEIQ